MIKIENVSFKYKGSKNNILENLNFSVNDGEVIAIVGKNGSGKSTIGKLITGINKIKSGSIIIDDLRLPSSRDSKLIREKVGIVFQNPENQIIFNNVYDELSFSLKGLDKSEIDLRINKALEQVGMADLKDGDLYSFSLGQKQRIVIAEVLAKNPKYIIFDEPTTMLDGKGKEIVYNIIKNLKTLGYTIICITNLADEILLADRTLILDDGKIACEIHKKDLVNNADILKNFDIKMPTLLKILVGLKNYGININLKDFSTECLIDFLKGKLLNE